MFRIGALILLQEKSIEHRIVRRRLRNGSNPLELPDTLFIQVNKAAFTYILEVINNSLPSTEISLGITPLIKLCACLRFYAEGGYQKVVARDYEVKIAQSTFCEDLSQVLDSVEKNLCGNWITYPTEA